MGSGDVSAGRIRSAEIGAAELNGGCQTCALIASSCLIDVWEYGAEG